MTLVIVDCEHDGVALRGELYAPQGSAPRPAVMVMHSALGLGHHVREVAGRLSDLGYAALVTDMFGSAAAEVPTSQIFAQLTANPDLLRNRVCKWFDTLAALPGIDATRIAAIGYCFGGLCALELGRSGADVRASISFHGLLTTKAPAQPGAIRGDVAVYTGALDPYAPPEDVAAFCAEMDAAGARYQLTSFSHAAHSFADRDADALNRPGIAYDAMADKVSWAGMTGLLAATLG